MTTDRSKISRALFEYAAEIATYDRDISGVVWYYPSVESGLRPAPIVPCAVHDAMCVAILPALHDQAREVVVCTNCQLAVEWGAS